MAKRVPVLVGVSLAVLFQLFWQLNTADAQGSTNSTPLTNITVQITHTVTNDNIGPVWQTAWTVRGTNGLTAVFVLTNTSVRTTVSPSPSSDSFLFGGTNDTSMMQSAHFSSEDLLSSPPSCGDPDNPDSDNDGLPDSFENAIGTDPNNPDSDGDGYTDLQEVVLGSDPFSACNHPAIPPFLTAWWTFDDGTGTLTTDASGNLQTGVLEGTPNPGWVTNGVANGALSFDGSNAFLVTPATAMFCNLTTQLTVSVWINPLNQFFNGGPPLVKWNGYADDQFGYSDDADACGFTLEFHDPSNVWFLVYSSDLGNWISTPLAAVSTNQWTYLTATYDGSAIRLFTNGVLAGLTTTNIGNMTTCGTDLSIANDLVNFNRYYHGLIDDVRIYYTALGTADVYAVYKMDTDHDGLANIDEINLYHTNPNLFDSDSDGYSDGQEITLGSNPTNSASTPAGVPPYLLGWWKFLDGTGNFDADSSSNRMGGDLVSSPSWIGSGVIGGALQFDGSTSYLTNPPTTLAVLTTQLTIAVWINTPNQGSLSASPIMKWNECTEEGDIGGFTLEFSGATNVLFYLYSTSAQNWIAGGTVAITSNMWTHLAAAYDGSNLRIYKNGVAVGSPAAFTDSVNFCVSPLSIAHDLINDDRYLTGQLADVRVYDKALASNDVSALYNTDSLGDGIPNWWRQEYFGNGTTTNSSSCASCTSTNPWAHDLTNLQVYQNPSVLVSNNYTTINDGIPDWWKVTYGFSLTDTNVASADPDGDGLSNLEEYQQGTNPLNWDTDGDGLSDGAEVHFYHTSPLTAFTSPNGNSDPVNVLFGLGGGSGSCDTNFSTCFRISSDLPDQPPCGGIGLTVSGTVAGHKYDIFYTDTLPPFWKLAQRGIVATGTNFTWTDCGSADRSFPTGDRFYVAGVGDDTDGDGIGSAYEVLILGTSPDMRSTDGGVLSDGDKDFDGDQYSNLQEYLAGTDPFDPTSRPINEWNGPFASWDNIKTKYHAVGDGHTDDTPALSNMVVNIGVGTNSPVVYFPNGTYLVSSPMYLILRDSVRLIGQDPAQTIIKASGAMYPDYFIFGFDRTPRCSFERITFEGTGATNLMLVEQAMSSTQLFDTACEYVDCIFTNAGIGLVTGGYSLGGSEVSILRDKFYACSFAGLMTGSFNALDNWAQDCEFGFCSNGLTDAGSESDTAGAGGFNAYQCLFHDNTNDINIGNTAFFSFRDNLSTNSGQFMYCGGIMAPAQITLQRNMIIDPKTITCINDGNEGQLALIDNTFLTGVGTVVYHSDSGCESFSISNRYLGSNAASLNCQAIVLDDQIISRPLNTGALVLSATATNLGRFVTNLWSGATGSDIQNAIYAVTNRIGQRPVVHLPWGTNNVSSTIVIPGGMDVQLEGDSFGQSILNWTSSSTGAVIQVGSSIAPATAILRNFGIEDGGRRSTGVVAYVSNNALWARRLLLNNSTDTNGAAFLVKGCTNATIDLLDFQFGASITGMKVVNSTAVIRIRGCATGNSTTVIMLTNTANVCIDDMWYEGNDAADFLDASGSGTFTVSGFNANVNVNVGPDGQAVLFTNWTGTALMQNGGIRDKVVPASGSGSLWLNGLTYFGFTNPLPPVGLATFGANNLSVQTNRFGIDQTFTDYFKTSDSGPLNTNLVHSSMLQLRNTKALQNPSAGSMIIESVIVDKSNVGLFVK